MRIEKNYRANCEINKWKENNQPKNYTVDVCDVYTQRQTRMRVSECISRPEHAQRSKRNTNHRKKEKKKKVHFGMQQTNGKPLRIQRDIAHSLVDTQQRWINLRTDSFFPIFLRRSLCWRDDGDLWYFWELLLKFSAGVINERIVAIPARYLKNDIQSLLWLSITVKTELKS